jgi:hypothetical protein
MMLDTLMICTSSAGAGGGQDLTGNSAIPGDYSIDRGATSAIPGKYISGGVGVAAYVNPAKAGPGGQLYAFMVNTTASGNGANSTLRMDIIASAAAALTTPYIVASTPAYVSLSAPAFQIYALLAVPPPWGFPLAAGTPLRYLGLQFIMGGTAPTASVRAGFMLVAQSSMIPLAVNTFEA